MAHQRLYFIQDNLQYMYFTELAAEFLVYSVPTLFVISVRYGLNMNLSPMIIFNTIIVTTIAQVVMLSNFNALYPRGEVDDTDWLETRRMTSLAFDAIFKHDLEELRHHPLWD